VVRYVEGRLRLLVAAAGDDADELVNGAARVLVAFVADGRPADRRLNEVEVALAPLRDAVDKNRQAPEKTARAPPRPLRHPAIRLGERI